MSSTAQRPNRNILTSLFTERPVEDHAAGWCQIWDTGNSGLFDRGKPSPALIDLIEDKSKNLFSPFTADGRRKRALVPGCGRGYDVVALALHGFDAYGVDVSQTAVSEATEFASAELADPKTHNFASANTLMGEKPGSVKFVQGDFFATDWQARALGEQDGEKAFDLIYEYTFLCALHPSQRRDWASRMASLLNEGGLLVCLEFPMFKDPKSQGPPWGLKGVHWNLLSKGGDGWVDGDSEQEDRVPLNGEFTRKIYYQPDRTYEPGMGTDMLSVYVKK